MQRRTTLAAAGLATALALAIPLTAAAAADDAPSSSTTSVPTVVGGSRFADRSERRAHRQALGRAVAARLGISVDELRAAVREARSHPPAEPIADRAERRAYWLHQGAIALGVSDDELRAAVRDARAEVRAQGGRSGER